MNPAFEELAMFENMIDVMFKNEYDVYVFDTAPTANVPMLNRLCDAIFAADGAKPAEAAGRQQEAGARR